MSAIVQTRRAGHRSWHLRWLVVLVTGLALFGAVLAVTVSTGDPVYLPSLLLLGAAVVPVTLTTFISEVETGHQLTPARILTAGVLGGVIGAILAGPLELQAAHALGSLSFTMVGVLEEAAKLAIPAAMLAWRTPRPRAVEGLVLGVAVGSAFAAVETMGYAFTVLLRAGGGLAPVADVLGLRAVGSLGGHAAWTGLACAALFAVFGGRSRARGWLRFAGVFALVVVLHASWDATARGSGDVAIGLASFALLMGVAWWLRRAPALSFKPAPRHDPIGTLASEIGRPAAERPV